MSEHTIIYLKFPRPDDKDPEKTYWDDAGSLVLQTEQPLPREMKIFGRFNGHGRIVGFIQDRDGGQRQANTGQPQQPAPPPGYPPYPPQGYAPPQGYPPYGGPQG